MKFVKMHGIRNDYVYLDAVSDPALLPRLDHASWAETVRRMSDRHSGIGGDGVIVLCPPSLPVSGGGGAAAADVRMRMFNSDGSESQMCGNGIRCVAKFAHDRLGIRAEPMRVETGRGVLEIRYRTDAGGKVAEATVDMGEPILEAAKIPVLLLRGTGDGRVVDVPADGFVEFSGRGGREWMEECGLDVRMTCVSMGNPHAVFFCGDVSEVPLATVGPLLERQTIFPERINSHFVQVISPAEARMRTWERGAGATLACGTGACASLVAGALTGRLSREALMHLPGGDLRIRWDERSNHVFMTGPAEDVFEGEWAGAVNPGPFVDERFQDPRPILRTDRLVLRPVVVSDAARMTELAGDRAIAATTLLIPHPYTVTDAEKWISTHAEQFVRTGSLNLAVCLRRPAKSGQDAAMEDGGASSDAGELVGVMGLRVEREHSRAELGYWIGKPFWNQGYASEASRAMIEYAFNAAGLNRVYAYHYHTNPASGRVLVKAGMRPEGRARAHVVKWGEAMDSVLYAVLKSDRSA